MNGSISSAAGGDERLHQAGDDVVDVPGDGDARGDRGCGAQAFDVSGDGRAGVEDGVFVEPEGNGKRLTAYVVAPRLTARQLLAALRREIDPAFLPRPLIFVDLLPRNALGKLTRRALEHLALETIER